MADKYSAIIAAGGSGSRFGHGGPLKEKVGGKSVLSHSLDMFESAPECAEILICASRSVREWIAGDPLTFACEKFKLLDAQPTRAESVAAAARAAQSPLLVIQDGSRPNAGEELLKRVLASVTPDCGAAPARLLADAVIFGKAKDSAASGAKDSFLGPKADYRIALLDTVAAAGTLYETQSPQAYFRESYLRAVDKAGVQLAGYADDAALYAAAGSAVALVAGRLGNLKVVTPEDLNLLHKLMDSTPKKKDKYGGLGW